jgi:hypothetical protein
VLGLETCTTAPGPVSDFYFLYFSVLAFQILLVFIFRGSISLVKHSPIFLELFIMLKIVLKSFSGQVWWFMLIILATWIAKISGIAISNSVQGKNNWEDCDSRPF